MMFEQGTTARRIALSIALLMSMTAIAQVSPPGVIAVPGNARPAPAFGAATAITPNGVVIVPAGAPLPQGISALESADPDTINRRMEERQQQLRAQLADPEQRRELIAQRIAGLREMNPELARTVGIDAATEDRLLTLLMDQQLSAELSPNTLGRALMARVPSGEDPVQQQADEYDAQMREISRVIGAARFDAYLDYDRNRSGRTQVEQFDRTLPAALKLTAEQKDAFALLLTADVQRRLDSPFIPPFGPFLGKPPFVLPSADETNRRIQLANLANTEQTLRISETVNRTLLATLPHFLKDEQVEAYAAKLVQQLESMRQRAQQLRSDLGLGAEDPLEIKARERQAAPLPAKMRLAVKVRINGSEVTKTVTGVAARFKGPEGLLVEMLPSLVAPENLKVELKFYETLRGNQHLIGQSASYILVGKPEAGQRTVFNGPSGAGQLIRGRKAYRLSWNVKVI